MPIYHPVRFGISSDVLAVSFCFALLRSSHAHVLYCCSDCLTQRWLYLPASFSCTPSNDARLRAPLSRATVTPAAASAVIAGMGEAKASSPGGTLRGSGRPGRGLGAVAASAGGAAVAVSGSVGAAASAARASSSRLSRSSSVAFSSHVARSRHALGHSLETLDIFASDHDVSVILSIHITLIADQLTHGFQRLAVTGLGPATDSQHPGLTRPVNVRIEDAGSGA